MMRTSLARDQGIACLYLSLLLSPSLPRNLLREGLRERVKEKGMRFPCKRSSHHKTRDSFGYKDQGKLKPVSQTGTDFMFNIGSVALNKSVPSGGLKGGLFFFKSPHSTTCGSGFLTISVLY